MTRGDFWTQMEELYPEYIAEENLNLKKWLNGYELLTIMQNVYARNAMPYEIGDVLWDKEDLEPFTLTREHLILVCFFPNRFCKFDVIIHQVEKFKNKEDGMNVIFDENDGKGTD